MSRREKEKERKIARTRYHEKIHCKIRGEGREEVKVRVN